MEPTGETGRSPESSAELKRASDCPLHLESWVHVPEAVMPGKSGSPLGVLGLTTGEFKNGLNGVRGQFF